MASAAKAVAKTELRCNSFAGVTPVLMADGTSRPIDQVKVGDTVANAAPDSPTIEAHPVTAIHITDADRDFVDLTVDTLAGPKTITTTAHHLFWDTTTHTWTDAQDLTLGDQLDTPGDGHTTILATRAYTATIRTYNLTIDTLHTYYVEAGATPVLVHNCGGGVAPNGVACSCSGSVNPSTPDLIHAIATRAEARIGGTGPVTGTLKHTYADRLLTRYQGIYGNRGLVAEQSYLNGVPVPRGTPGSARPDVFDPAQGLVYDYKFVQNPGQGISAQQANKNALNVPGGPLAIEVNP